MHTHTHIMFADVHLNVCNSTLITVCRPWRSSVRCLWCTKGSSLYMCVCMVTIGALVGLFSHNIIMATILMYMLKISDDLTNMRLHKHIYREFVCNMAQHFFTYEQVRMGVCVCVSARSRGMAVCIHDCSRKYKCETFRSKRYWLHDGIQFVSTK